MSTNKRAFLTVEQGTIYEVPIYEVIDGKGIEETGAVMSIQFVRGSKLKDEDVPKREGTLHEHIISVMIEDLNINAIWCHQRKHPAPSRTCRKLSTGLKKELLPERPLVF